MTVNQDAIEVASLAGRLVAGYYSHLAAIVVASHPSSETLLAPVLPKHTAPIISAQRRGGSGYYSDAGHFLKAVKSDPELAAELARVWLTGALLRLGDTLEMHGYFDRAPILELVRHLRNGVAHGNRFRITKPERLLTHPAHNRKAQRRDQKRSVFEITGAVNGKSVLFEFLGPGDVLDVLNSCVFHLHDIGYGPMQMHGS